jgi:hypothetical protein
MKNKMLSSVLGVLCFLIFANAANGFAQQKGPVDKPFELNLSGGGFIKTMEGSVGLGGTFYAEPRYYLKPNFGLTFRYQGSTYSAEPFMAPGAKSYDIRVQSLLAGAVFRNRTMRHAWFYGAQTGIAFTEAFQGTDQDGYDVYGDGKAAWVIAPRVGYAFHRFEMELGYHYSTTQEARFGQFTLGWRFWGNRKPAL